MKLNFIKIYIPVNFNIILISKFKLLLIIIFNENKKFKFFITKKKLLKLNKNLNFLEIKNENLNNNNYILKNYFINFFRKMNQYYFLKIKFKGKGYKIGFYKKKKIINFFFGKSHKTIFIYKNVYLKKLTKYKFILLKNNINDLKKLGNKILNIKNNNPYTNRGLRFSRQLILKRKGRKGAFV